VSHIVTIATYNGSHLCSERKKGTGTRPASRIAGAKGSGRAASQSPFSSSVSNSSVNRCRSATPSRSPPLAAGSGSMSRSRAPPHCLRDRPAACWSGFRASSIRSSARRDNGSVRFDNYNQASG
jgi:hypothetical protein